MKKLSLILIAFVLILASCSKENQDLSQHNSNLDRNSKSSSNPYNEIGERHNEILYAIGQTPNFHNITTLKEHYEYMLSYIESIGDTCVNEWSYYDSLALNFNENQSISELALEFSINDIQYLYLEKLDNIIVSYIDDNKLFNSEIDKIENVFSSESRISDKDKFPIWGAFSTARYSANFWYDARINTENPWYPVIKNSKGPNPPGYTGTAIGEAWADAKGWVHGFFHPHYGGSWHTAGATSDAWSLIYRDLHTPIIVIK